MCLTLPDSQQMRLNVDEIILKYRWCVQELLKNGNRKKNPFKNAQVRVDMAYEIHLLHFQNKD